MKGYSMMSKYVRVTEGLQHKGYLISKEDYENQLSEIESEKDIYASHYYYNDEQKLKFEKTGSISGITEVVTDKLLFDLDSKDNIELARKEALIILERLKAEKIPESSIEIYHSGQKGYSIGVKLNELITPEQHKEIAFNKIGKNLVTIDASVYNASRIVRVPNTRHPHSKLYKISLTHDQLKNLRVDQIKQLASKTGNIPKLTPVKLNNNLLAKVEEVEKKKASSVVDRMIVNKPRHWKDYKFSLLNAEKLQSGERHKSLQVIAATCRGLGYPAELAELFLNYFDERYAEQTKQDKNPEEVQQAINSVFSDSWNGGQYSKDNDLWLKEYAKRIGKEAIEEKSKVVTIDQSFDMFSSYAKNIDALTIKTGIPLLDNKLRMTVGMSIGIVAAPSVGKSSIALQILHAADKQGIPSIFFSYDMFHALIYQKLIQKHFKMTPDVIFAKFKENDVKWLDEVRNKINEEYKNVRFCFESGQTIEMIEETIKQAEEAIGQPIKLIVVDYNELVLTDHSDSTTASNFVAQKLREIANTRQLCSISLFQPNKMAGSPADALTSYRAAKGGSGIEQSVRVMLGMYRPGYDPTKDHDNFITISCLKNNMGQTFSLDFAWNGLTGTITELDNEQKEELTKIRQAKAQEKAGADKDWS